eukprot:TRINITY_DN121045_c0_g1_i1.p1 TRINITY_DN121045_c0_g1~~TRINITY_DN121045_c0_g1_i1.p1  ORF type:complete len:512 (-),score=73.18 TRINITY_DN121045_c0_g1_i1:188-1723(-)
MHWQILFSSFVAQFPAASGISCEPGWLQFDRKCFYISNTTATFVECQDQICTPLKSVMASAVSHPENKLLSTLLENSSHGAFVGAFRAYDQPQDGADQSLGKWAWVDGSMKFMPIPYWAQGEPNSWCVSEDCAIIQPGHVGWADVACGTRQLCICEQGESDKPSNLYLNTRANLTEYGFGSYTSCFRRRGDFGIVACFWYRDFALQTVWTLLGLPSVAIIAYAMGASMGTLTGTRKGRGKLTMELHDAMEPSPYGQLLDLPAGDSFARISNWVTKAAWGEILYAAALLALATTEVFHVQTGFKFSFAVDAAEALVMFFCKMQVALTTFVVSNHLSPYARAVAGPWVIVLAVSKVAMALCALGMAAVSSMVFDSMHGQGQELCSAGYLFCWSLLASLVFQSVGGFAIFQIQERAVASVQNSGVFSSVLGCSWSMLMGGTFGVGGALGLASALFVFDDPTDHIDPFHGIGISYAVAGLCQLLSGFALLMANQKMDVYFKTHDSAREVEMMRGN